jgi:hypothetical protein
MGAKDDAGVGEFRVGKKTRIAIACALLFSSWQLQVYSANPPLSFFPSSLRPCQDAARLTLNSRLSLRFAVLRPLSFAGTRTRVTIKGRRRHVDRIQL